MKVNYLIVASVVVTAVMLPGICAYASEIDQHILVSANESFVFKTYLKDDAISTHAKDGVVTLRGTVSAGSNILLAKETVASLPGVKRVDVKLELENESTSGNSDRWISTQVKYALLYNKQMRAIDALVLVNDGVVTLRGNAISKDQKDLAKACAEDIKDVKEVRNEMVIAENSVLPNDSMGYNIDDPSITAQVKLALLSHKATSIFRADVKTYNGVVIISGNASSSGGKVMAAKVASDVIGVRSVVNNMTVRGSK